MAGKGGRREGAGRKPKADEIALIETMDAVLVPAAVWGKLAMKVNKGDVNAIKTWLQYRFGMPKQSIDHSNKDGSLKPVAYEVRTYEQANELKKLLNESNGGIPKESESS